MFTGSHPNKIHKFCEKFLFNLKSLKTLGKLKEISRYKRMSINKIQGIRSDLVRTDDNWREWDFPKFLEALRKWRERNPIAAVHELTKCRLMGKSHPFHGDRMFQAQQKNEQVQGCVYCRKPDHKSVNCKTAASVDELKQVLSNKHLWFNCTSTRHKAADCKCRALCQVCQKMHHTFICDRFGEQLMTATSTGKRAVTSSYGCEGLRC